MPRITILKEARVKLLLVYSKEEQSTFRELKRLLMSIKISIGSYEAAVDRDEPTPALYKKLKQSTHIILFFSKNSLGKRWFLFASGYSVGRDVPVYLYITDKELTMPEYLKSCLRMSSLETVSEYFVREARRYESIMKIEKAKKRLLERGIPISKEAFMQSVERGDKEAVVNFLSTGFSPNEINEKGIPVLSLAIRKGERELAHILIQQGANVNTVSQENGNTPLMDAAANGEDSLFEELIASGADLDAQSRNGQTALMLTVGQGRTELAAKLIKSGADVSITDKLGMSARKYAELFKQNELLKLIGRANKEY